MAKLEIYNKAKDKAFRLFPEKEGSGAVRSSEYKSYKDLKEIGKWKEDILVPLEEKHELDKKGWRTKLEGAGELLIAESTEDVSWCHDWYVYGKTIPNCFFLLSPSRKTIAIDTIVSHRTIRSVKMAEDLYMSDVLYCVWAEACERSNLKHMVGELQKIIHLLIQNRATEEVMDIALKGGLQKNQIVSINGNKDDAMALHGCPNGLIGLYILRDHQEMDDLVPGNVRFQERACTLVFEYMHKSWETALTG